MRSPWVIIGAASGARIAYTLLFSAYMVSVLPGEESSTLFQWLFLQAGLTTLMSASGFARGSYLSGSPGAVSEAWVEYVRFVTVTALIAALLGQLVLLPLSADGKGTTGLSVLLLVVGAGATSVNGFLQGATSARMGRSEAFLPTLIVSGGGCLWLGLLWRPLGLLEVTAIWVAVQIGVPVALLATSGFARSIAGERGRAAKQSTAANAFVSSGAANTVSVGAVYVFREQWMYAHSASTTASGFFVVRLVEVFLQVLYLGLASAPRVVQRFVEVARGGWGSWAVLIAGGTSSLGALVSLSVLPLTPGLWGFVLAESLVLPTRVIACFCLVALLFQAEPKHYAYVVGSSVAVCAALTLVPAISGHPFGLQLLQGAMCVALILGTVIRLRMLPRT